MKLTIPFLLIMCAPMMAQHRIGRIDPPSGGFVEKAISEVKPVVKKPIAGRVVFWLPLTSSDTDDWFYRPADQLFRLKGNVGLWIMNQSKTESGYSMDFWIIRCVQKQAMLLQFADYTKNHKLVRKSPELEVDWMDISPDTLLDVTRLTVCRRR